MTERVSRPCLWTLPSCFKTLHIEDLNKDDESKRQAAFQLVSDAAQRADNIGTDEFPVEWFDLLLQYTDVAVLLYKPCDDEMRPQSPLGFIAVPECRFANNVHRSACQLMVVTATELSGRPVWRDLARLGVALAAESKHHYIDCFVEVFVPCLEHVLAMRDEGFIITACIPTSGMLAGQMGHVDSYIMYKQLDVFGTHCVRDLHCFQ